MANTSQHKIILGSHRDVCCSSSAFVRSLFIAFDKTMRVCIERTASSAVAWVGTPADILTAL
jgi:hypothetical protein